MPGSQRSDKLRLTRYIDNDEVEAEFGQDAMVAMCGPAGTCFLEDTYGIHRAGLPVDRPRLILSAQYNIWRLALCAESAGHALAGSGL